jgi:DNA ligase D-like protein (predicted ligase)
MSAALPEFVAPMLAKIGEPFSSDDFLFEIKWDGTRGLTFAEGGGYRLLNRKQRPLEERYPEFAFLADLPSGCVLDGEIVVMKDGKPDFSGMLQREQAQQPRRITQLMHSLPATYVVFDLLYRAGGSICGRPLEERRESLRQIVTALSDPRIVFSDGVVGEGLLFFEQACRQELEGIIAKRRGSRYLPGRRTDAWLKIKRKQRIPCAIVGYVEESGELRSLAIAAESEGVLRYAGRVGSGLTDRVRDELLGELRARRTDRPYVETRAKAVWVEPGLYCTVEFLEWTENRELRAPVFVTWMTG